MKKCFKCGKKKSLSEFYEHPMMKDGHLNKCKDCTKKDASINRRKNIDYYRAYDNSRASLVHRRALGAKTVAKLRAKSNGAHSLVDKAIKMGQLVRQPCQMCGTNAWVAAHHDDYSKPLDVMWLCPEHHAARHAFLNYESV